jgi:hypothetical protein
MELNAIKEITKEIFKELSEEKIQEIRQRIIQGDYPGTWSSMETAIIYGDRIGAGLFFGLISAQRRHSNRLAYDDVLGSAEYLEVKLPKKLLDLRGLVLAKIWEQILKNL